VITTVTIDPCNGHVVSSIIVDGVLELTPEEITQDGNLFIVDASRIDPGIHIMDIRNQYNHSTIFRFVKE
jgi:hypothetical protein